jgi:hypothetical protein
MELLRRWLRAFGPATTTDIRWWTGWTAKLTASTLAAVGAVEVGLDDGAGWLLPDDLDPPPSPAPWVALLPALDATVMGWKQRDWYLGEHAEALFDRNGNAGPTVWAEDAWSEGGRSCPRARWRRGCCPPCAEPRRRRSTPSGVGSNDGSATRASGRGSERPSNER